jgi:hypothetical protein
MELKPRIISEFAYDEIEADEEARQGKQRRLRSSKTIQKFMFPVIPTKKNIVKPKSLTGNDGISNMIRKLINDSQTIQRSNKKQPNRD